HARGDQLRHRGHVRAPAGEALDHREQGEESDHQHDDRRRRTLVHRVVAKDPGRVLEQARAARGPSYRLRHSPIASRKCCSSIECAGRRLVTSAPRATSVASPALSVRTSSGGSSYSPAPRDAAPGNTVATTASPSRTLMT